MMTFNKMERQMEFQSTSKESWSGMLRCSDGVKNSLFVFVLKLFAKNNFFSLLSIVSFLLFSFRGWCWLCSRSHNSLRSSFAAPFFESEEKNIKINLTSLLHCTNKNKTNFDLLTLSPSKRERKRFSSNFSLLLLGCNEELKLWEVEQQLNRTESNLTTWISIDDARSVPRKTKKWVSKLLNGQECENLWW